MNSNAEPLRSLIFLAAAGCAAAVTSVPKEKAEEFLSAIARDEATRLGVGADGTVALRKSGVPLKGQLSVLADANGRLRVDVASEAGNLLFALASDGKIVTLIDMQARRFYKGGDDLTPLGLPGITAFALSRLFLARQPCAGARVVAEDKLEHPRCMGAKLTSTYKGGMLRTVSLEGVFDATLLAHTSAGLPRRLEIKTKEGDVVVQLTDVDLNPKLADAAFVLTAPPGINN